jgi:hypothetical protein
MTTTWKTISSKVTDETYGAIKVICEKDDIKPNEFIRKSVEKAVNLKLNKDSNPEVFPNIGENKFEYDSESDSFMWTINFGSGNSLVISRSLSPFFIESILNAIKNGVEKRKDDLKKIKKNKTYIPESIIKFREK